MNCPDCFVAPGEEHLSGCDVEMCTHCGWQWISCGHQEHDPSMAIWTGEWPGNATCRRLGYTFNGHPDLNRLALEVHGFRATTRPRAAADPAPDEFPAPDPEDIAPEQGERPDDAEPGEQAGGFDEDDGPAAGGEDLRHWVVRETLDYKVAHRV